MTRSKSSPKTKSSSRELEKASEAPSQMAEIAGDQILSVAFVVSQKGKAQMTVDSRIADLDLAVLGPVIRSDADFKEGEKEPNKPEQDASGKIDKKIKRDDPEFKKLKKNMNSKIVFKDEEGTGADRMMSKSLSDKLDDLANLVANEWSGTKLRVTEAWDEDNEHAGGSLHYEGRAADLTTSPIDGGKLGRLCRLAVNAGFDWVYFEDSKHIHVSVKK
ncbi:MAG: hypothetical protein AAGD43_00890 [Pseudomonadota bacterium]